MKKRKKINGAPCAKCKSTLTYIRIKTGKRVCRTCGHIESIKIEEVK